MIFLESTHCPPSNKKKNKCLRCFVREIFDFVHFFNKKVHCAPWYWGSTAGLQSEHFFRNPEVGLGISPEVVLRISLEVVLAIGRTPYVNISAPLAAWVSVL